jgi:hypothetical protein
MPTSKMSLRLLHDLVNRLQALDLVLESASDLSDLQAIKIKLATASATNAEAIKLVQQLQRLVARTTVKTG